MRNKCYSILCVLLLLACNDIPEQARYELLPEVDVKRKVLLEEFTGQMCTNCPEAHRLVGDLRQQYGEHLVTVAVHAGVFGFAETDAPGVGLMQPEGDTYAEHWGVATYPSGVVNRMGMASNHNEWAARIRTEMAKDASLNLIATADTVRKEDGSCHIQVAVELMPLADIKGKLQLWVTENNVASLQIEGNNTWLDYNHQHIYRASINGIWGEEIALQGHLHRLLERSISMKEGWKAEDIRIVAFVYNETHGVLQVTECAIR